MKIDTATHYNNATKATILDHYGDLLTVEDLSNFFGVSKQTVYKEIREGKLGKPLRFGREYRIPKVHIINNFMQGFVK